MKDSYLPKLMKFAGPILAVASFLIAIIVFVDLNFGAHSPVTTQKSIAFGNLKVLVLRGWQVGSTTSELTLNRGNSATIKVQIIPNEAEVIAAMENPEANALRKLLPEYQTCSVCQTFKGCTLVSNTSSNGGMVRMNGYLRAGKHAYAVHSQYSDGNSLFERAPATDVFLTLSLIEEFVSLREGQLAAEWNNPFEANRMLFLSE